MRKPLDQARLQELLQEIARSAPRRGHFRVFLTGGATAVERGWRNSTLDADLSADTDAVLREVQQIKERLNLNIELARPTDFVPSLPGEESRHVLVKRIGNVDFYHFDPYAQALSKIVRGFERDLTDVSSMIEYGLVDRRELKALVNRLTEASFARYPSISRKSVLAAVDEYTSKRKRR